MNTALKLRITCNEKGTLLQSLSDHRVLEEDSVPWSEVVIM
jgi:hypothetical protein